MKKTSNILSLILLALLQFSNIVNAQDVKNVQEKAVAEVEQYSSSIYAQSKQSSDSLIFDSNGNTIGKLSGLADSSMYEKFFKKVSGIKRISNMAITLKPYGYLVCPIRIETDKGTISCGVLKSRFDNRTLDWTLEYYPTAIKDIPENKILEHPEKAKYWIVNGLTENDNEVTISIFKTKDNQLLCQKTYKIDSKKRYYYSAELHCKDTNGSDLIFKDSISLSKVSIDWDKPMRIVVKDNRGNSYQINKFNIIPQNRMGGTLLENYVDENLSPKVISILRRLSQMKSSNKIIIGNIEIINNEGNATSSNAYLEIKE